MVPIACYFGLRPPGSKDRYSGLNRSPLGTRSGANFANTLFDNVGTSKYLQGTYRFTFVGTYRYLHVSFVGTCRYLQVPLSVRNREN